VPLTPGGTVAPPGGQHGAGDAATVGGHGAGHAGRQHHLRQPQPLAIPAATTKHPMLKIRHFIVISP
jgi:hypothetical protein